MSCSRTQHGGGRSRTPDLSLRSPTLYHWANPLGPKLWCQQEGLITIVICCKFKKNLFNQTLYTSFHDLINVYSSRSGADNPRGQNFDLFATSLKQISLKSSIHFSFHDFIHAYSPWAGANNLGTKLFCQQQHVTLVICCKFKKNLFED